MKHYLFSILIFVFNCAVSCIDDDIVCFTQPGFYKGIPTVSYSCDSHYPPTQPIFNDVVFRTHNTLNTPAACVRASAEFSENMSVDQLTDYFYEVPPQKLFSKSNLSLLMSDVFVDYIKQFPEYEGYIEHFHEKFHKSSGIKKYFRNAIGHRLCQLHREIKVEKKLKQAQKRAAVEKERNKNIADQHAYLCEQWQQQIYIAKPAHKGRLEKRLAAVHDAALEDLLQEEFITLADAAKKDVWSQENSLNNLLIEGIDVGTAALHKHQITLASQTADFCWATLDLMQAVGEGVLLAGYNTAAFLHQIIFHPQETVHAFIEGICAIADTLFIINDLPDQLRECDIPNKEYYYQKIAQTEQQLEDLGNVVAQRIKEMKPRDWVKQGTAFVVEGMLLHKVTQLTFNACSRLKPLFGELLRSAEYEEIIAACVDGERISLSGLTPEIENTTMLMQEAEKDIHELANVVTCSNIIKTDLIDAANKCIELENQWVSRAGLIYGIDEKFGTRINHVLEHTKPNIAKPKHTIFNIGGDDLLQLIDDAWLKRGANLPDDVGVFIVDMERSIGTLNETHIRIVVKPDTCKILTAYPTKG